MINAPIDHFWQCHLCGNAGESPSPNRENPTILKPQFWFMLNPIHLSSPFMIVSIRMEHPKDCFHKNGAPQNPVVMFPMLILLLEIEGESPVKMDKSVIFLVKSKHELYIIIPWKIINISIKWFSLNDPSMIYPFQRTTDKPIQSSKCWASEARCSLGLWDGIGTKVHGEFPNILQTYYVYIYIYIYLYLYIYIYISYMCIYKVGAPKQLSWLLQCSYDIG